MIIEANIAEIDRVLEHYTAELAKSKGERYEYLRMACIALSFMKARLLIND